MCTKLPLPLISIIIPVYNGLSHGLSKCLDSIWRQEINNDLIEVICVDDCSTDNTLKWLSEQKKVHYNLKVIAHSQNKRQGGARNTGIQNANGHFIAFIDQDDYYDKNAFCSVIKIFKDNPQLDLLIVDATYERPGIPNDKLQHNFTHTEIMSGDDQIRFNSIPWAPWKFIFKKSLVCDNNLWFNEKERFEDVDWVHKLTHFANITLYQPILFIHYVKNDTSTTMTSFKSKEIMYSSIRCALRILELIDNEFINSQEDVKLNIRNLGNHCIDSAIRIYIFCRDKTKNKVNMIQRVKTCSYCKPISFISKLAFKFPRLFSIGSNISSFITPHLLIVYRKVKYTIRGNKF